MICWFNIHVYTKIMGTIKEFTNCTTSYVSSWLDFGLLVCTICAHIYTFKYTFYFLDHFTAVFGEFLLISNLFFIPLCSENILSNLLYRCLFVFFGMRANYVINFFIRNILLVGQLLELVYKEFNK